MTESGLLPEVGWKLVERTLKKGRRPGLNSSPILERVL